MELNLHQISVYYEPLLNTDGKVEKSHAHILCKSCNNRKQIEFKGDDCKLYRNYLVLVKLFSLSLFK